MKVNFTKTEFAVFHKSLNCAGRIRIGVESIEARQDMGVLGIVFDNRLEWTKQVDKSILRARQSSQALRRIKNYFSETEINKLVTSLVFSRMYYGSEIWLIPNLKERHFSRLYSQSGRSLKLINKEWSYRALHDSGCAKTIINQKVFESMQQHGPIELKPLERPTVIITATGEPQLVAGSADILLHFEGINQVKKSFELTNVEIPLQSSNKLFLHSPKEELYYEEPRKMPFV